MNGPDPDKRFPNGKVPSLCFIKNVITRPNIIVGDYTYYDDDTGAEDFEKHVTHLCLTLLEHHIRLPPEKIANQTLFFNAFRGVVVPRN